MLKNMKAGLAAGEVKPTRLCRKERFLRMRKNRWRDGDYYQQPKINAPNPPPKTDHPLDL